MLKNLDETTTGGRIRKCRIDAGKNLKEFAKLINISPNHLGLVERGEKNASMVILKKIADATGVSYKWLNEGKGEKPEPANGTELITKEEAPMFAANVSPQLVLTLALRSPSITKETLATFLMVPVDTIEEILAGGKVDYNPAWGNIFPVLVQRLDIPAVRQELKTLDAFLAKEGDNVSRVKLLQSLRAYASSQPETEERPQMEYKIAGAVENKVEDYDTEDGKSLSVMTSRMMLESVETPDQNWYFAYFPFQESVTWDTIKKVFQDELEFAEGASNIRSASIVISSKTVFQKFDLCVTKYLDSRTMWQHDPTGSVGAPAFQVCFSIILVDSNDFSVKDAAEYVDEEYAAAVEQSYSSTMGDWSQ